MNRKLLKRQHHTIILSRIFDRRRDQTTGYRIIAVARLKPVIQTKEKKAAR
jgi:hypothetical protein